ncbi:unnamed protein product [Prorocentrum cordatum]|uniref:FHA domain-containing protein n=1 Tax=Prorocentrum cordatum TaxID=2364126 RepID=A0ABN9RJJ9_9DINO|nr:unnamed protein product [Polarella glacialis]
MRGLIELGLGDTGCGARDIIDTEVRCICRRWPEVLAHNSVVRRSHGRYRINGRDVLVRVVTAEGPREDDDVASTGGGEGEKAGPPSEDENSSTRASSEGSAATSPLEEAEDCLGVRADSVLVRDGPLTQPFLDYVFDTGKREHYDLMDSEKEFQHRGLQRLPADVELELAELPYDPEDRSAAMSAARVEVLMRQTRRISLGSGAVPPADEAAQQGPLVDDRVLPERAAIPESALPRRGSGSGVVTSRGMMALLAQRRARELQDREERLAQELLRARGQREVPLVSACDLPGVAALSAAEPAAPRAPLLLAIPPPAANAARRRRRRLFGEVILPGTPGLPPFEPEGTDEAGAAEAAELVPCCELSAPLDAHSPGRGVSRWRKMPGLPVDLPASLREDGLICVESQQLML